MGSCRHCKFVQQDGSDLNCRYNPPHPIASMTVGLSGKPQMSVTGFFPPVSPTTWCGKFESKEQEETADV